MRLRRAMLSRAVIGECVPSFLLAVSVTTFLLLIRSLFTLADLLISRNASPADLAKLLGLALPHVLALTIPMAFLFAVLTTTARMSTDSEVVALQSCGVRPTRLLRPLLVVAAVLTLLDLWVTTSLVPWGNRAIVELTTRLAFSGARAAVESRSFTEDFPGYMVYVDQVEKDGGRWKGVLLFDLTAPSEERLVTAETGVLAVDPRDGTAWLNLTDTSSYVLRAEEPESAQRTENRELSILLTLPASTSAQRELGVRATESRVLLQRIRDASRDERQRLDARVELHKRFAIPVAAMAFAVVAFPLGLRNRRGGRGFGLTASVGLVLVYYVLLNNGTLLARSGKVPVLLGVWLPNLALVAVGVALLRRLRAARSDDPGLFSSFLLGIKDRLARRRETRAVRTKSVRLRRLWTTGGSASDSAADASFPQFIGIVDTHVLRQCIGFFLVVLLAVIGITVAVKFSDQIDDIQKHGVPFAVVFSYYLFSLPQVLQDILPISFLIAFLATATVLDRNNETTALKAAGVSLTRVVMPLLLLAAALGVGLFVLGDSVVQRANRQAQRLEDVIHGRRVARSYRATDRPWMFLPDGRTLVSFVQYDPDAHTLLRPSLYVFGTHLNLRAHYGAQRAVFEEGRWRAVDGWLRRWLADGSSDFDAAVEELPLPVEPSYFGREFRRPSQMSFGELRDYVRTLRTAGYRVDRQIVQLHLKLAYPASLLLLSWLALPYAFGGGRRGTVRSLAVALVLAMGYFGLTALVTKLGEASLLPPVLAAWTPSVVFALLAANRHTVLKT